jgi:hypothetical protein
MRFMPAPFSKRRDFSVFAAGNCAGVAGKFIFPI